MSLHNQIAMNYLISDFSGIVLSVTSKVCMLGDLLGINKTYQLLLVAL